MRNARLLLAPFALLLILAPMSAQTLPADAQPTCVASSTLFNSWFQSGSVSLDGIVNPANSIAFQPANNCNFYLWSQQMLLWLLSPAPSTYGGTGRVLDSGVFYDVSEPIGGKRYFIPHIDVPPNAVAASKARRAVNLRPGKPGPNGLPAVSDRDGNIIEVVPANLGQKGRSFVLNQAGKTIEVSRVTVGADRKAIFHDAAGNVIAQPKLNIPPDLLKARVGQRFFDENNTPIIVSPSGVVFDVSPGQAGSVSGVLLAQNSSVTYYSILANDVYAYFASGVNSGKISAVNFPTTQAELDTIQSYAGQTFPDGVALAVEIKLSWVDVSAVTNPGAYITSPAFVPTYDTTDPKLWKLGPEKFTTLALVGVHFVGSATNHPEMIWSTFEHFGNAPTGQYQYVNSNNQTITVPANSAGTWVFAKSNSKGPFNIMHADYDNPPNIEGATIAKTQVDITPSDTQLVYAFGVGPSGQPNQQDLTPAAANTELISINNSVLGQLAKGDVRANYYLIGSTWTFGGYTPNGQYNVNTNNGNGSWIGTNQLANSTMETYHQAINSTDPKFGAGSNCFSCHNGGTIGQKAQTVVSHIFSDMAPIGSFPAGSATDVAPPQVIPVVTSRSGGSKN